jgi:hypothetical protein
VVNVSGRRDLLALVGAVALVVGLASLGYLVVQVRAAGGGTEGPLAAVSVAPSAGVSSTPSATPSGSAPRPPDHWIVAKAVAPVVAYVHPSLAAPVRARFGTRTANGFPTLFLVRRTRDVGEHTWYQVWLPVRPTGRRGWIAEGRLATYPTTSKIVISLSRRRLTVTRGGHAVAEFSVAVGTSRYPTPTGFFYVSEKLRPADAGGPYGVLALALSAYQPQLGWWPGGGQVAIHGTNQDSLIGQAVSHGCVRMHDADILKVSRLVPAGSPVFIER